MGLISTINGSIDWRQSFSSDLKPADFTLITTVRADEISPFCQWLANQPGKRPIIEYPMMIGDHFNPFYHYQHFHRRPALIGYTTDLMLSPEIAAGNIYGNTYIDQILSLVGDKSRLRFHNFHNLIYGSTACARGEFVILHKRFEAQLPAVALPLPDLERLGNQYRKALGKPFYEGANIAVFRL